MYEKQIWEDRSIEKPLTYYTSYNEDGTITLTPCTGEVYKEGSKHNAQRMNHIEEGIEELEQNLTNKIEDNKKTIVITETGLDLNNFTEDGRWFFTSSYTPLNIPSGNNGWLEVFTSNTINTIKQIWYRSGTANSNDFQTFVRTRTSGVWSSWKQFAMVEDTGWKNAVLQDGVVAHAKRWKQCSSVQKSRRQSVNKRSSRDSMGWNNS